MDTQLAQKLARRQKLIEEAAVDEEAETNGHGGGGGVTAAANGTAAGHPNGERVRGGDDAEESRLAISSDADDQLKSLLARRQEMNDGREVSLKMKKSIFAEFHEFSRQQLKQLEKMFRSFDENCDGFVDLEELKKVMEKLGAPQTHVSLKAMIKEVDEDKDDKIDLREFLLIFKKAGAGELQEGHGLSLLASLTEIDVKEKGVEGAKNFFEAKIEQITKGNDFEEEIKAEREEKRKTEEEKKQRREAFKAKQTFFANI